MNDDATVDGSLFEGLARALQPTGAFAEALRTAGFDVNNPKLRYPSPVLLATLDLAHRHLYPDLSREAAHRRVGQRVVGNFYETIFGRVLKTLLQVLGAERFLVRLPKIAPMGSTGLEVKVERPAPGEVRLFFRGQDLSPDFFAGTLDVATKDGSVEIAPGGGPAAFELRVTGLR